MPDCTVYHFHSPSGSNSNGPLSINLPPHLQNLIVRALIRYYPSDNDNDNDNDFYLSFLPAAVDILKASTSLHCTVTLEIKVDFANSDYTISDIDLSSLTDLAGSMSIRRIDLHFNFWGLERTKLISLLADDLGLAELMEQGVLVVHLNEHAPSF